MLRWSWDHWQWCLDLRSSEEWTDTLAGAAARGHARERWVQKCREESWSLQAAASRRAHSWEQLSQKAPLPPQPGLQAPSNAPPCALGCGSLTHQLATGQRHWSPRPSIWKHTAGQFGTKFEEKYSENVGGRVIFLPAFQGKLGLVDPRCIFSCPPDISTLAFETGIASLIFDSVSLSCYLPIKWSHYILLLLI